MQVQVKITGDKETIQKLRKLGRELYMLKSAMDDIGKSLEDYYGSVAFASQGGVFGEKWPMLNRKYALRKAKMYPGRSPLVATGQMQRSFTSQATQTSVYVTNDDPIFKYHQSTRPRTKMPRRAMIAKNRAVVGIVEQIIKKEVQAKIKRAGL